MHQEAAHLSTAAPRGEALGYAPFALRPRHSFYSIFALVMALVTIVWLGYIRACSGGTPHWLGFNPVWVALYENFLWPGGIGVALAVVGLIQNSRKRTLSIVAVVIIVVAYLLLFPPFNFA